MFVERDSWRPVPDVGLLVEAYVGRPGRLKVDREDRIVRGLVLLGEHSRNGYDYGRDAMKDAARRRLYGGVVPRISLDGSSARP